VRFLLLAIFLALLPGQSSAAAKTPHRVPRMEAEVRVDGVLDEGIWQEALRLEPGIEVDPGENIPAPVATEAFLAYGATHLYVAFRAWDPDPAAISARLSDRDEIWDDDWVKIVLDTFNDERRTYNFACNPLGIQADLVDSPEGGGEAWDAIWACAGRIHAGGYVVEMAIPFRSLSFQRRAGDQIWGVDAVRHYPRDVAHEIGLFPRDRSNNCYMCQSEKLIGFAGGTPGRAIELDPTFSALRSEQREGFPAGPFVERETSSELGLTAHWGMTANLTASATVNPDFSQVEADAAQLEVNTQFALSYPEKRPFFLAGADFFTTRVKAVHTRTLADPRWGVKLTGKQGRHAIGAFVVEDEITNLLFPASESSRLGSLAMANTSSVVRYRRDLGRSSTLGLLVTDREGDGDYSNRLFAVDADLKVTTRDRIRFQLLGSRTRYPDAVARDFDQPAGDFDGTAFDLMYVHATRNVGWFVVHHRLSSDFRADLGFVPQAGYTWTWAGWRYTWYHDPGHWYTSLKVMPTYQREEDDAGNPLSETVSAIIAYTGPRRSYVTWNTIFGTRTYRGVEFDLDFVDFSSGFWPTGSLSLNLTGAIGDWVDYVHTRAAKQVRLDPSIEYRIGRHLTMGLDHAFEQLELAGGRLYRANISRLRAVFHFTGRSFLRTILQYVDYQYHPELYTAPVDSRFKHLFSQVLFSYKLNPQTVLFLGYSDNHFGDQDVSLTQRDRTVFLKVGYAWVL